MIRVREKTPPSINNYWKPNIRGGRFYGMYLTTDAKNFKKYIGILAKNAGIKKIDGDCHLIYRLYQKKKGRKDLDNTLKVIQDALEGIAYNKDSQIVKIDAVKVRNAGFDGFDIIIEEYKG